jgi:PAS domain S-box-containing protein
MGEAMPEPDGPHPRGEELRRIEELAGVAGFEIELEPAFRAVRSEEYRRLHGLPHGIPSESWEDWQGRVHPEDRAQAGRMLRETLEGGKPTYDSSYRIIRPSDGEVRWIHARGVVEQDGAGRPTRIVGVDIDVTERRQAERDLRDSEERLRIALEAGRMGTYRFDVATGVEDWSDSEYRLLGLPRTPEAPTRELFLSLVHPDDLHLVQFSPDDERPPGTPLNTEFRIIRPDSGEERILTAHALARFDDRGRPLEVIGVNRDVTAERRAEAALRASEERLQQFSHASSDILWMRDAVTLEWVYLSPAFEHIYGLSRQDALQPDNYRRWLAMIVPDDRETVERAMQTVRAGGRMAFEFRIKRPDGGVRWLRNADFPVRDAGGNVTHIAGVASDVTSLREAAEHQRVLLAELQHRVRNTLGVIRSIARRTAQTSTSMEDYAMNLEGRIDAFARVQSAVTRDPRNGIELAALVAEELRAASMREGEGLLVEGPPLRLNPQAAETLGLALHELATNAIKYGALSVPRGRVEVTWTVAAEAGPPMLVFVWRESGVPISVPPNRRGFGSEILERTPVYQLNGQSRLAFGADGVHYTVSLPLGAVVQG